MQSFIKLAFVICSDISAVHMYNQCKMQSQPWQMMGCQSRFELSSAKGAVKSRQCVIILCFISSGLKLMQTILLFIRPGKFISKTEEEKCEGRFDLE